MQSVSETFFHTSSALSLSHETFRPLTFHPSIPHMGWWVSNLMSQDVEQPHELKNPKRQTFLKLSGPPKLPPSNFPIWVDGCLKICHDPRNPNTASNHHKNDFRTQKIYAKGYSIEKLKMPKTCHINSIVVCRGYSYIYILFICNTRKMQHLSH